MNDYSKLLKKDLLERAETLDTLLEGQKNLSKAYKKEAGMAHHLMMGWKEKYDTEVQKTYRLASIVAQLFGSHGRLEQKLEDFNFKIKFDIQDDDDE